METNEEKHVWKTPKLVQEKDWKKLRQMRILAVQDSPKAFGDSLFLTQERSEEEWRKWANNTHQFVVERNDQYVSSVTLRRDNDGAWIINGVWTDPGYPGQGLSTMLFEAAFEKARVLGIKNIGLDVNPLQKEAVALYKKLGFVEKGKIKTRLYGDGQKYQCIAMDIELT